ncbi:DNA/RNA non-specific endonuclease [Orrella marina]|uniref:DNA/RNA non-specific endonuclease n=1 Tax=Orrella marina TaxID=2163011 RepID=A0A2R4XPI6_9BURK|nr:DNA/RNA non-specific endonuclease [Orrella marina]AWB35589.1 DNA/RNA non-specific endonuclease [Orrella marina]
MSAGSRTTRSRSGAATSRRRSSGSVKRFLRAMLISAFASFSVASYALIPQWRDYLTAPEWLTRPEVTQEWSLAQWIPYDWGDLEQFPVLAFLKDGSGESASDVSGAARSGYGFPASRHSVQQGNATHRTLFAHCPEFFVPGSMPTVPAMPELRELCFSVFAVLHSGHTKTPVFVAQRLNRQMLQQAQSVDRRDRFYEEARLPERERARLADYRGSGYSRGHMAPAGDMHTEEGMAQSFSLANMVPQNQRQNAGPWNQIEQATRKYIMRAKGDVYVLTGPVYGSREDGATSTIGDGRVAVPDYLYKVVYDPNTARSWVHWQANDASAKAGPPISYAEFVERTGLHLLPDSQLGPSGRR